MNREKIPGVTNRRARWRTAIVTIAIAWMLYWFSFPSLQLVFRGLTESGGFTLGSRTALGLQVGGLLRTLPVVAFAIVYLRRSERMRPAYWLLPTLFLAWGASTFFIIGWGLLVLPEDVGSLGGSSIPVGVTHLVLAAGLWAVRPTSERAAQPEPPSEPPREIEHP